jgi:hypothetical protein
MLPTTRQKDDVARDDRIALCWLRLRANREHRSLGWRHGRLVPSTSVKAVNPSTSVNTAAILSTSWRRAEEGFREPIAAASLPVWRVIAWSAVATTVSSETLAPQSHWSKREPAHCSRVERFCLVESGIGFSSRGDDQAIGVAAAAIPSRAVGLSGRLLRPVRGSKTSASPRLDRSRRCAPHEGNDNPWLLPHRGARGAVGGSSVVDHCCAVASKTSMSAGKRSRPNASV